jgi:hypothetical protein
VVQQEVLLRYPGPLGPFLLLVGLVAAVASDVFVAAPLDILTELLLDMVLEVDTVGQPELAQADLGFR